MSPTEAAISKMVSHPSSFLCFGVTSYYAVIISKLLYRMLANFQEGGSMMTSPNVQLILKPPIFIVMLKSHCPKQAMCPSSELM